MARWGEAVSVDDQKWVPLIEDGRVVEWVLLDDQSLSRKLEAGTVLRHPERGELVTLIPVPCEDGAYSLAHSRWILVSLGRSPATWDNTFHESKEAAVASQSWEFYAESPEAAFARKFNGKCDMPLCPGEGKKEAQHVSKGVRMCYDCLHRTSK